MDVTVLTCQSHKQNPETHPILRYVEDTQTPSPFAADDGGEMQYAVGQLWVAGNLQRNAR